MKIQLQHTFSLSNVNIRSVATSLYVLVIICNYLALSYMEQISMFHYNYPKINSSLITTVNSEILLKYLSGNPQDLHSESVIYFPLPIHRLPSLLLPLLPRNWQVRQVLFWGGRGGGGGEEERENRGEGGSAFEMWLCNSFEKYLSPSPTDPPTVHLAWQSSFRQWWLSFLSRTQSPHVDMCHKPCLDR